MKRQHRPEREAVRRERERLRRDLHDGLSQDLFASSLALAVLLDQVPTELRPPIQRLIERHELMIAEVRDLLNGPLADGVPMTTNDLITEMDTIARRESGQPIDVRTSGTCPTTVSADVAQHSSFALREMLSNAVRHSGSDQIRTTFRLDGTRLMVQVDDTGDGNSEPTSAGLGLANLSARAQSCGGWFRLVPRRPAGTRAQWTADVSEANAVAPAPRPPA